MPSSITYYWGKDQLTVHLAQRAGWRVRVLMLFEALMALAAAAVLTALAQAGHFPGSVAYALQAGAVLALLFGIYRYMTRRSFREYLVLDSQTMGVLQKSIFTRRFRRYTWPEMGPLRYCGGETKTDHPLKGQRFDYWGFDTHENLIQDLHREGAIAFQYRGRDIRFGKGLYLWHAEELADMLRLYAGPHLRFGPGWSSLRLDEASHPGHNEGQ